ncbi:hypothetical protein ACHQM5_022846 [Ranunculus cassubicifolius]
MLSLKLVRSLILGDTINTPFFSNQHSPNDHNSESNSNSSCTTDNLTHSPTKTVQKRTTPFLIFLPTNEIIKDTYKLCSIARAMGMNLQPNPSLSHIIFSWPSPSPSSSCEPSSLWSSSTSSSLWSCDFVPLPFPSLTYASATHLQCFVGLSRGLFKVVFLKFKKDVDETLSLNQWNCSSVSLFSRVSCERIESMDGFCRVLVGMGWTMFKSKSDSSPFSGNFGSGNRVSVYLFRKFESNRVEFAQLDSIEGSVGNGKLRVRELRLPTLDFGNAPFRILQYILLMTDDIFYLA